MSQGERLGVSMGMYFFCCCGIGLNRTGLDKDKKVAYYNEISPPPFLLLPWRENSTNFSHHDTFSRNGCECIRVSGAEKRGDTELSCAGLLFLV